MKKRKDDGPRCVSDPGAILKMLLETDAGNEGEEVVNQALLDLAKEGKVCIFQDEKGNVMIRVPKKEKRLRK